VCELLCRQTGICNVTVNIENIAREAGDHYPQLIDENGTLG
jgi:hypothetical protein